MNIVDKNKEDDFLLHKLVYLKQKEKITEVLASFTNLTDQKDFVNKPDLRGNSPLFLSVMLKNDYNDPEYLEIIKVLSHFQANPKLKNKNRLSPFEFAIFCKDAETISVFLDAILLKKLDKLQKSKEKISNVLQKCDDFFLEMRWEFDSIIPLVSKLAPNDTCYIWKIGSYVKMDSSFEEFVGVNTIRIPKSFIFKENENSRQIIICNKPNKTYYNTLELLDDEEKSYVINDILDTKVLLKGEFKMTSCQITESRTFFGNKEYEKIGDWNALKYDVKIKSSLHITNKKKIGYKDYSFEKYFDTNTELETFEEIMEENKDFKSELVEKGLTGTNLEKDALKKSLVNNLKDGDNKKLEANVWITENFPLKSSEFVSMINSIGTANELTLKINEFMKNPDVQAIIEKNGFPIKFKIPITFFLSIVVTFNKFRVLNLNDEEKSNFFKLPPDFQQISRKEAQNLKLNEKRRMLFSKIAF